MKPLDTVVHAIGRLKSDAQRDRATLTGVRASLRRWRPGTLAPLDAVAFAVGLGADLDGPAESLTPLWSALSLVAFLADQHADGTWLGQSLHEAGLSELRLERLLRAEGEQLRDQIRLVGRMLAAKGTPVDVVALARLLFFDTEEPRLQIAKSYYRAQHAQEATHG